jgi:hypothetical protein
LKGRGFSRADKHPQIQHLSSRDFARTIRAANGHAKSRNLLFAAILRTWGFLRTPERGIENACSAVEERRFSGLP